MPSEQHTETTTLVALTSSLSSTLPPSKVPSVSDISLIQFLSVSASRLGPACSKFCAHIPGGTTSLWRAVGVSHGVLAGGFHTWGILQEQSTGSAGGHVKPRGQTSHPTLETHGPAPTRRCSGKPPTLFQAVVSGSGRHTKNSARSTSTRPTLRNVVGAGSWRQWSWLSWTPGETSMCPTAPPRPAGPHVKPQPRCQDPM